MNNNFKTLKVYSYKLKTTWSFQLCITCHKVKLISVSSIV